ncbi:MAG: glycosyltransferase [Magnetococcus sp. WYHC-3]
MITVSVVTGARNEVRHLRTTAASVLAQTRGDWEWLLLDDASDDGTAALIDTLAGEDRRIRALPNPCHLGLTATLNRGIAQSRGRFIARLDAADLMDPRRLEQQVAFLETHPAVGVLGSTQSGYVDGSGQPWGGQPARLPDGDAAIRWVALLENPFLHSAVMFRRDLLDKVGLPGAGQDTTKSCYDESYLYSQDYELWTRLLAHTRGANLPEPLVTLRRDGRGLSETRGEAQRQAAWKVSARALAALGVEAPPLAEWQALRALRRHVPTTWDLRQPGRMTWLLQLWTRFRDAGGVDGADLHRLARELAEHLLATLPARQWPRHGRLLMRIAALSPGAVPTQMRQRLWRRWGGDS